MPAAHGKHTVLLSMLKFPAGQGKHAILEVLPNNGLYLPASQKRHALMLELGPYEPGLQAIHDAEEFEYVPEGHISE